MIPRRGTALFCLVGLGVPALGLALASAAAGCSFPSVTFTDGPGDAGQSSPDLGANVPDTSTFGDDDAASTGDGRAPDSSTSVAMASIDGGCDYNGTWATRITIDVNWTPQGIENLILTSGSGTITQWVKGVRVQGPPTPTGALSLSDDSVVCGIALPDFQSTLNEVFGVRFPDKLFDEGYIPPFTINGALTPQPMGGLAYSTTPTAVLLGVTMANPTTDPWPTTVMAVNENDQDQDNHPGVTVAVATGPLAMPTTFASSYSYIPTGVPLPLQPADLASSLYLAIRQVTVATGAPVDCNTITGTVSIPTASDSKPAINSHILGCGLVDGGACTASEGAFVDNSEPIFTPTGTTTFETIRVANDAGCGDVRNAAFR
jgi:hypothetical protein